MCCSRARSLHLARSADLEAVALGPVAVAVSQAPAVLVEFRSASCQRWLEPCRETWWFHYGLLVRRTECSVGGEPALGGSGDGVHHGELGSWLATAILFLDGQDDCDVGACWDCTVYGLLAR